MHGTTIKKNQTFLLRDIEHADTAWSQIRFSEFVSHTHTNTHIHTIICAGIIQFAD